MSGSSAMIVGGAVLAAAAAVCVAIAGLPSGDGSVGLAAAGAAVLGAIVLLVKGFKGQGRERR